MFPIDESVQFSSVPLLSELSGAHEGRFNRDPPPAFSEGGPYEQFWHGQGRPLFSAVHPAFSLPTTAPPTLQGALKDGFREAVVTCDMPEPRQLPKEVHIELPCVSERS